MTARTGVGYDSHRFEAGRRLVLGGVQIEGAELGLGGHSDADVLAHAIIDALLGAAGLGDIGEHFPDSEERWRGADSMEMLGTVSSLLVSHGWTPRYVDATLVCEAPKLAGHRDEMRASVARPMEVPASCVSVKFTTGEGMGFVGRGEGIAALAVATIGRDG